MTERRLKALSPESPPQDQGTHALALPKGYSLEEYEIDSVLGDGGFGITYKARDKSLDAWCAIKEYFPREWSYRAADGASISPVADRQSDEEDDFNAAEEYQRGMERFLHEARVLARVKHGHVVRVIRHFAANGSAYIVMEYEPGRTLASVIRNNGTLEEQGLRALLEQTLSALEAVHAEGFLHRDLKPGNIYLRARDNGVMLIDFGAALWSQRTGTRPVTSMVTPGYSPTEQYSPNSNKYGQRTDIYALGAVLYRCISGKAPIDAASRMLEDSMTSAREVGGGRYDDSLLDAIDRALAVRPEGRFQSVSEMREALGLKSSYVSAVRQPEVAPGQFTQTNDTDKDGIDEDVTIELATHQNRFGKAGYGWASGLVLLGLTAAALGYGGWWWFSNENSPESEVVSVSQPRYVVNEEGKAVVASKPLPAEEVVENAPDSDAAEVETQETQGSDETAPLVPGIAEVEVAPVSQVPEIELVGRAVQSEADSEPEVELSSSSEEQLADSQSEVEPEINVVEDLASQESEVEESVSDLSDAEMEVTESGEPAQTVVIDPSTVSDDEIEALLMSAKTSFEADRLTTPADDSAFYWYRQVLEADPDNAVATAGFGEIAGRYAAFGRSALRRGDIIKAERYARRGLGVVPDQPDLLTILREAQRAELIVQSAPVQRQPVYIEPASSSDQQPKTLLDSFKELLNTPPTEDAKRSLEERRNR